MKTLTSFFRVGSQINIPTSGEERFKYSLPRENKISQMPYNRANKDNQIPIPCLPPPPPPPPPPNRRLNIRDLKIRGRRMLRMLLIGALQRNAHLSSHCARTIYLCSDREGPWHNSSHRTNLLLSFRPFTKL